MNFRKSLAFALATFGAAVLVGCSGGNDEVAVEGLLDETETEATSAAALTGKFLHLSDIHFDVFAGTNVSDFADKPIDEWSNHFNANVPLSSGRGVDTNYALLMSALDAAAKAGPYDFILYTGDYLPHGYYHGSDNAKSSDFAAKVIEFVNYKIAEKMPKTPIVGALGNNDSGCGDYSVDPNGNFLKDLSGKMPGVTSPADFAKFGFYTIDHPTVPGTQFLTMGTFWSAKYPGYEHGHGTRCPYQIDADAPGELQNDWLENQLGVGSNPTTATGPVILLMHVPPGMDGFGGGHQWHRHFESDFEKDLPKSKRPVIGAFAGHTHMDEMRVLSDSGNPYLALRVAPSVTTYNGNEPSFTVADYDTSDGRMTDYEVHSYRPGGSGMAWQSEYRFSKAYNVTEFTPANVAKLAAEMQQKKDPTGTRATYLRYYSAKDQNHTPRRWKNIVCATSNSWQGDFDTCKRKLD